MIRYRTGRRIQPFAQHLLLRGFCGQLGDAVAAQSLFQRGLDRVTSGYPAGAAAADGFSGVARDRRSVYTHSTCI